MRRRWRDRERLGRRRDTCIRIYYEWNSQCRDCVLALSLPAQSEVSDIKPATDQPLRRHHHPIRHSMQQHPIMRPSPSLLPIRLPPSHRRKPNPIPPPLTLNPFPPQPKVHTSTSPSLPSPTAHNTTTPSSAPAPSFPSPSLSPIPSSKSGRTSSASPDPR